MSTRAKTRRQAAGLDGEPTGSTVAAYISKYASKPAEEFGVDLVDGLDPYACGDCLVAGDSCVFHAGFAEGWDSCMEHVTRWATGSDAA